MNTLQEQIELKSQEIHTDSYPISIGEIMTMYKDGDLDIHPEFQRFFRWTLSQKTKLIESILLNIPIPPIFVAQRKDGIWDIVDGLQRMSTILQFVGILKDIDQKLMPPLVLDQTKLLTALKDKVFGEDSIETENSLTDAQRRYFKREKINFIIIKKESDESSKYELFQRLNTGGTSLTPQEVRSCMMVMVNSLLFQTIKELATYESFLQCVKLSDKNIEEQYDIELIIRFICLRNLQLNEIGAIVDLSDYLDNSIVEKMQMPNYDWENEFITFKKTFDILNATTNDKSFWRYDCKQQKYTGGFLVSAYEILAISLGKNPNIVNAEVEPKLKNAWTEIEETNISWKGYSASGRLTKTLRIGRKFFQNEEV